MSDCEHAEIYWYDKEGVGIVPGKESTADHGRCVKCWAEIPKLVSLHSIYCDCERCTEVRKVEHERKQETNER